MERPENPFEEALKQEYKEARNIPSIGANVTYEVYASWPDRKRRRDYGLTRFAEGAKATLQSVVEEIAKHIEYKFEYFDGSHYRLDAKWWGELKAGIKER